MIVFSDRNNNLEYIDMYADSETAVKLLLLIGQGDLESVTHYTDSLTYRESIQRMTSEKGSDMLVCGICDAMFYTQALLCGVSLNVALPILTEFLDRASHLDRAVADEIAEMLLAYTCAVHDYDMGKHELSLIRKAKYYIHEHMFASIQLEELAAFCRCSLSTIQHLFKAETGQTLKEFIRMMKIQKACQWFENTSITSRQTGERLGYCSQSYFIKEFKRVTGMTPTQYIQTHRKEVGLDPTALLDVGPENHRLWD